MSFVLPSTVTAIRSSNKGRYLIVNADDFGCCEACNEAVKDLFEKGALLQASIMMTCGKHTVDAAKWAAENPVYVAPHLTFTSEWGNREEFGWRPIRKDCPSIVDKDGVFYKTEKEFQRYANPEEVKKEIRAQIVKFFSYNLSTFHADNHMGTLYGINPTLEKATDAICFLPGKNKLLQTTLKTLGEYKLAFRFPKNILPENVPPDAELDGIPVFALDLLAKIYGIQARYYKVPVLDHLIFPYEVKNFETYEEYKRATMKRLKNIPYGITETFFHPGVPGLDLDKMTGNAEQREWEYKLLSSKEFKGELKENGVEIINYQFLKEYF